jgi:hypothetical protein
MTFSTKFVLEEAPMSRRHIELFFGRVGLGSLVEVNALLVTQVFKFSFSYGFPHNTSEGPVNMYCTICTKFTQNGRYKV